MNNAVNRVRRATGASDMGMRIVGLIIMLLVLFLLYYLYTYFFSSSNMAIPILQGNLPTDINNAAADKDATKAKPASYTKRVSMTGLENGGQYSVSMWVYIKDTKGFQQSGGANLASLFEISDDRFNTTVDKRGDTLLYVGLNPTNASLVVRQSTSDGKSSIQNKTVDKSLNHLITKYNTGTKYTSSDRCDIINGIEYQRWVLITVVANGRTLDVYLDGKLARSCVYRSPYGFGNVKGAADLYLGANNDAKLKGYFATTNFYNYALAPDAVWSIYQTGPAGPFDLKGWIKGFFSTAPKLGINVQ